MANRRGVALDAISAGYHDWNSVPHEAHALAMRAIEELCGSDLLAGHLATRWTQDMVQSAALVVVAEEWMKADFPGNKVVTMRGLAGRTGDVEDPYGGDYPVFFDCALEIRGLLLDGWELLTRTLEYAP
jgi:hypothetical protein